MNDEGHGLATTTGGKVTSSERSFRILVVDDDKEASTAIVRALKHLGHDAFCCGHAQAALALVQSRRFDLLLVDYRMPDLTGLDLVAMLRHDDCTIPVVMMTGYFATEERVLLEQLGISGLLRKPISLPQLSAVVDDLLVPRRTLQ